MQSQLKDLQRSVGVTFCYVTHDQGEAFSMSDRVAVMNLGLLEQLGTPEDIYHRPASAFVADFVGTANRFPGRIESGGSGVYSVAIDGIGTRGVPGPDGLATGAEVIVVVRPENLALGDRRPTRRRELSATVVDAAFLGAERTVRLNSPTLGDLTASARGAGAGPGAWLEGRAVVVGRACLADPRVGGPESRESPRLTHSRSRVQGVPGAAVSPASSSAATISREPGVVGDASPTRLSNRTRWIGGVRRGVFSIGVARFGCAAAEACMGGRARESQLRPDPREQPGAVPEQALAAIRVSDSLLQSFSSQPAQLSRAVFRIYTGV